MKHKTEDHLVNCGCRSVGECSHNDYAWMLALDACIDDFADNLKQKLHRKALEGKRGWDDPNWLRSDIIAQLRLHIGKGDMLDVAAFAMFAWNQEQQPAPTRARRGHRNVR